MRRVLKIILSIVFLSLIFVVIYLTYRKVSLNNYLNLTIENVNKINYSTSINLNINDEKFIYDIDKSSYIQKITVSTYNNDILNSSILKYYVLKGSKKGTYILNDGEYKKITDDTTMDIDYEKLKENIISIKSMKNTKKYRKYIVKIKGYDAYNLIYNNDVLTKKDYDKCILLTILIDKENNFISQIKYEINDITNTNDEYKADYQVDIKNTKINNKEKINLPF